MLKSSSSAAALCVTTCAAAPSLAATSSSISTSATWTATPTTGRTQRRRHHVSTTLRPPTSSWPGVRCLRRSYATQNGAADHDIPPAWPRSPNPTPYEIFDIPRSSPYTKRRFYQLVKLYHPDTHDHHHHHDNHHHNHHRGTSSACAAAEEGSSSLSSATRLERYRLVVAANLLLSDPTKRRLYDIHGIGWTTTPDAAPTLRDADRAWRHQPGNAANNATWEDWERWHEARQGHRREPLYMSNGLFATLVVIMCMVGAMAQANRAEASGAQFVEFTQERNAAIGRQMMKESMAAAGRSKDERVDTFLRERENVSYDYVPSRFDESDAQHEEAHR
ncbi:J domain-containing protein 1 [Purpureocillium takamizusanense]|uniref:J domain-containing protein 1 n=1 Tax=Purpureocillium takamizusanense TaxID=2060973 RepID=A0A9Q8VA62_9HYPO|nr:J domain-containing protein 1 [Purpureocillium takamizusanense]UNI17466.1 J domain-containing protein 1 [Purpureocillium takamizusanense]